MKYKDEDLRVVVMHPAGDILTSFESWKQHGPGERPLVQIGSVIDKRGNDVPLRVIPLKYRNTRLSRFLIRCKLISNPW